MAHYRKIDVAIWNDATFASMKLQGKMAFVFLITHPNMTGVGAMRATLPGLSAELGISQKDFGAVFSKGLAVYSAEESCVFIPRFIKYQGCDSLNVLKSWIAQLQFIPHGKVKDYAIATLYEFIEGNAVAKALGKGFAKEDAKNDPFVLAFHEAYEKAYDHAFVLPKGYPVSSKQLAVSKPPYPAIEEVGKTQEVTTEVEGAIDPETGEVIPWAA